MLKVTHYSADRIGGAARAALRIHLALRQLEIIDSRMIVTEKQNDDYTIDEIDKGFFGRLNAFVKSGIDELPKRLIKPNDNAPRSAGWSTRLSAQFVNSNPADIAHLHWINGGFLSVEEIGKIKKPIVWTLHDMWPFCGAEHLAPDTPNTRWRTGYQKSPDINGIDLDRWVWKRKKSYWNKPMHIVTPSRWLAECVRESELMKNLSVHVVPNALNTDTYKPMDKLAARFLLNLPTNRKLILFGAIKGTKLTYKGWDLLVPALTEVVKNCPNTEAVIFGQGCPESPPDLPIKVHWMGHLYDDFTLAALYSAADLLAIPSRQESFGQTGSEAQACGCPVVAFDATGLKDVVSHENTGLLVKPYDSSAMASAIITLLRNESLAYKYGTSAQIRARHLWSFPVVAKQYSEVYEQAVLS